MKTNICFWSYLAQFFLEWEMFQIKVVEKITTHILCSVTFFRESCRLWDNWKNIVETDRPQMTTWRMRIACWIPKATHTHTHTHTISNTYFFSTATMAARKRLNVTLYVHCLSYCCWHRWSCQQYNCSVLPWELNSVFSLHCRLATKYSCCCQR